MDAISEILVIRCLASLLFKNFDQLFSSDHSEQALLGVDYREEILASWTAIVVNQFLRFLERSIAWQGNDIRAHHFSHKQNFQRIEPVFAAQVITATRDLLGENGALKRKHRKGMRQEAGHEKRQQHVEVVRQLNRENDACERRAHRAAEDRAHADKRPESQTEVREK